MSPKLRWSIPPDAVKGAMDALQRSFVRFLVDEVQASSCVVSIADVASGWIVGKFFHIYARSQMPTPTRTWYGA
ncbi:hypothetical protein HAV15_009752 [Penicillium sp. str. |nr:hypothetical protein HAV15_009752 [Penicillium sp. str. \